MQEVKDKGFRDVTVQTDKGQSVTADLAIPCTGLRVNSVAYETSFRESSSTCYFASRCDNKQPRSVAHTEFEALNARTQRLAIPISGCTQQSLPSTHESYIQKYKSDNLHDYTTQPALRM